jgi:hypothetical protein
VILFVSSDLMFAGPIQSAARAIGHSMVISTKFAEPWAGEIPTAVVLDLAGSKVGPQEVARIAKSLAPDVRLLAFAPHVQTEAIEQAKQAGFHVVLTRGQFSRDPKLALLYLLAAETE